MKNPVSCLVAFCALFLLNKSSLPQLFQINKNSLKRESNRRSIALKANALSIRPQWWSVINVLCYVLSIPESYGSRL